MNIRIGLNDFIVSNFFTIGLLLLGCSVLVFRLSP